MSVNKLLLLVAVICFVLAALGIGIDRVSLAWLGMAFFAGSFLA